MNHSKVDETRTTPAESMRLTETGMMARPFDWKISWPVQIEVDSLALIHAYVLDGFGVGLSVLVPGDRIPAGLRFLPIRGLPPVRVGAFWKDRLNPAGDHFLALVKERARLLARAR